MIEITDSPPKKKKKNDQVSVICFLMQGGRGQSYEVMDRQFSNEIVGKCQLNALVKVITWCAIWNKYPQEDLTNINNIVRAMPIQFVIAAFQECWRFKFLLVIFSGQTLFRIQTRHFRSFLLRLVIAITMNLLPLFCLMKTIKYYNILLSFIGVLWVY